jgi:2-hydroxy-3-keto-5-methylthiopentenyl-1-phosphate phosphatase
LNTNSALGNRPVFYPTTSLGLFIGSTQASNSRKIYQNGILKAENTANDTSTLPTVEMVLGAVNKDSVIGFYGQREYSFFSIGDGLTDTEAANLYTAVQRFQTTLGRQV